MQPLKKLRQSDSGLKKTLIVITADHDHTLILNGYAKRTGKYVQGQETSVLGLVKNGFVAQIFKNKISHTYSYLSDNLSMRAT